METNIKIDEIWKTRIGRQVKVIGYVDCNIYPIEVQYLDTGKKYTVSKEGKWEIVYAHEPSDADLVYKLKETKCLI